MLTLARGAPVGFTTDRLLSPRTVSRATVGIQSGGQGIYGSLRYDPARRRALFVPHPDDVIFEGTEYQLVITVGLAAWDGTPMADPAQHSFLTASATYVAPAPPDGPRLSRDVAPLLAAMCASSGCHGGANVAMGLDLSSAASLRRTALGVMSRERPANSAGESTRTDPAWSSLERIDGQGDPAYSYLVYKIIGDGPIRGDRMPPPPLAPLTQAEIERVSDWIARGAPDD